MAHGKTIKLFLMDSDPNGRIKCSLANWTGVAYKIPRTMIDSCAGIELLKQSGVYFLFGTNKNGNETVYIGQAGARKNGKGLLLRVKEPHDSIDYWTEAIMLTTTNNSFGPTEICFLENRFCNMAKTAGRYNVTNSNEPTSGNITEETESELEEFIDYAKIVIGALGLKVLEPFVSSTTDDEPVFHMEYNEAKARGKRAPDGFVVLKGSTLNPSIAAKCPEKAIRDRAQYSNIIDNYTLTADALLSSPSAAAAFVGGASLSGNVKWKSDDGTSLGVYLEST